jgi:hypothetical protein
MSGLRVALIGLCCSIAVASIRAADLGVARHVAVAVCDLEGVPNPIMRLGEKVAGEVYRDIGVALEWADNECRPGDGVFAVSIASRAVANTLVTDHTLGFAESGTREATVLYDHVKRFSRRYHVNRGVLLGYVMAHELGHLLLPPKSHSATGVMCGTIDLQLASARQLRFTSEQGALILSKLAERSRYTAAARPQNCCDASRAPSDIAASLPQTTSGSTAAWPTHVP